MVGFKLENTLSENGQVTRGVCLVDENNKLTHIEEHFAIERVGNIATAKNGAGEAVELSLDTVISMNLWGFTPNFLDALQERFVEFLNGIEGNETKAEYLLPGVVGELVKENKAEVTVLTSKDRWFGVTYKEDKDKVVQSFRELYEKGEYPEKLF